MDDNDKVDKPGHNSEIGQVVAWRWRYLPWEGFPLGNWTYTEVEPDPERLTTSTGPIEVEALTVYSGG